MKRKPIPACVDTRMVKTHDGRILTLGILISPVGELRPIERPQSESAPKAASEVPTPSAPKWCHGWEKKTSPLVPFEERVKLLMPEVRTQAALDRIAEENKQRVLGAMNQSQPSWEQVVAVYRPAKKNAMRKQRGMDKAQPRERKSQSIYTTTSLEAMAEREHNSQD